MEYFFLSISLKWIELWAEVTLIIRGRPMHFTTGLSVRKKANSHKLRALGKKLTLKKSSQEEHSRYTLEMYCQKFSKHTQIKKPKVINQWKVTTYTERTIESTAQVSNFFKNWQKNDYRTWCKNRPNLGCTNFVCKYFNTRLFLIKSYLVFTKLSPTISHRNVQLNQRFLTVEEWKQGSNSRKWFFFKSHRN